jgi:hypothetical protein
MFVFSKKTDERVFSKIICLYLCSDFEPFFYIFDEKMELTTLETPKKLYYEEIFS